MGTLIEDFLLELSVTEMALVLMLVDFDKGVFLATNIHLPEYSILCERYLL